MRVHLHKETNSECEPEEVTRDPLVHGAYTTTSPAREVTSLRTTCTGCQRTLDVPLDGHDNDLDVTCVHDPLLDAYYHQERGELSFVLANRTGKSMKVQWVGANLPEKIVMLADQEEIRLLAQHARLDPKHSKLQIALLANHAVGEVVDDEDDDAQVLPLIEIQTIASKAKAHELALTVCKDDSCHFNDEKNTLHLTNTTITPLFCAIYEQSENNTLRKVGGIPYVYLKNQRTASIPGVFKNVLLQLVSAKRSLAIAKDKDRLLSNIAAKNFSNDADALLHPLSNDKFAQITHAWFKKGEKGYFGLAVEQLQQEPGPSNLLQRAIVDLVCRRPSDMSISRAMDTANWQHVHPTTVAERIVSGDGYRTPRSCCGQFSSEDPEQETHASNVVYHSPMELIKEHNFVEARIAQAVPALKDFLRRGLNKDGFITLSDGTKVYIQFEGEPPVKAEKEDVILTERDIEQFFPIVVYGGSGGGYRAMIATFGFLRGLSTIGFDKQILEMAGLSGSILALFAYAYFCKDGEMDIKQLVTQQSKRTNRGPLGHLCRQLGSKYRHMFLRDRIHGQDHGFFALFGAALVKALFGDENQDITLEEIEANPEKTPFPIGVAVQTGKERWYTISPKYIESIEEGKTVDTEKFGCGIQEGQVVIERPPLPFSHFVGLMLSAFAITFEEFMDSYGDSILRQKLTVAMDGLTHTAKAAKENISNRTNDLREAMLQAINRFSSSSQVSQTPTSLERENNSDAKNELEDGSWFPNSDDFEMQFSPDIEPSKAKFEGDRETVEPQAVNGSRKAGSRSFESSDEKAQPSQKNKSRNASTMQETYYADPFICSDSDEHDETYVLLKDGGLMSYQTSGDATIYGHNLASMAFRTRGRLGGADIEVYGDSPLALQTSYNQYKASVLKSKQLAAELKAGSSNLEAVVLPDVPFEHIFDPKKPCDIFPPHRKDDEVDPSHNRLKKPIVVYMQAHAIPENGTYEPTKDPMAHTRHFNVPEPNFNDNANLTTRIAEQSEDTLREAEIRVIIAKRDAFNKKEQGGDHGSST